MSTAQDSALRMALRAMLTEPDAWNAWIDGMLTQEEPWTAEDRQNLSAVALDWAMTTKPPAMVTVLRKALGEEISEQEEAVLPSQTRLESTRATLTSLEGRIMSIDTLSPEHNGSAVTQDTPMSELFGDNALKELAIIADQMTVTPYNTPPSKHEKAVAACREGRVSAVADAVQTWEVAGSKGTIYLVDTAGCSCPASAKSQKTRYACYHAVAAEMYKRWQRALQPGLFATPKTVEERLSQPTPGPPSTPQPHTTQEESMAATLTIAPALTPQPAPDATLRLPARLHLRSITAIVADLSKPLPSGCIASKTVKGAQIAYLHWQTVARMLDTYAPGWHGEVTRLEQHTALRSGVPSRAAGQDEGGGSGGTIRVTYRLHIPCAEGLVYREAIGEDDEWEETEVARYGNPSANAQANAFKRAAALLGCGQWLYDKANDPTAKALVDHFKQEKQAALIELGTALKEKGMARQEVFAWLKTQAGVTTTDQIPLASIRTMAAYVAQKED